MPTKPTEVQEQLRSLDPLIIAKGAVVLIKSVVDIPALFDKLIDTYAQPAIEKAIAKSKTDIDDKLYAKFGLTLLTELKSMVRGFWSKL